MKTKEPGVSERAELSADACRDAAARSLQDSPYAALHGVRCVGRDGAIVLRGQVPSFYMKQLAQELVLRIEGVQGVVNDLRVDDPAAGEEGYPGQTR